MRWVPGCNAVSKVLIVDDEPLARKRVRDLLAAEADMQITGESGDGLDAYEKVQALKPDVLFLDIKMPGLSGLQLSRLLRTGKIPYIIFTTAYSEYAVEAFSVDAVDYLMKPFDRERFRQALTRARSRLAGSMPKAEEWQHIIQQLSGLTAGLPTQPLERLTVKDGTRLKFLNLPDITHMHSDGDYLHIHTVSGEHAMIRERMHDMERRLAGDRFVRISRSVLVNLEHVKEIRPAMHGDYKFILPGSEPLSSGKTYRETIRELMIRFRGASRSTAHR